MAQSIANAQHVWNCRWSKLGYRLSRTNERDQPEGPWMCVRQPETRRPVTEEECAQCKFWETDPIYGQC